MAASLTQLTGGSFQDANGNVLAFGYLTLKLSQDGNVSGVGNICSGVAITIQLDANGNVGSSTSPTPVANQYVWANSNIAPINTYYKVTGFTQQGERAFGLNNQQVAAGATFNVGTWVPNSVISWFPEVSQTPDITLEVNGVLASSQTVQNLTNGSGITITDEGGGDIEISSTATNPVFEVGGTPLSSDTTINFESGTGIVVSNPSAGNVLITNTSVPGGLVYEQDGNSLMGWSTNGTISAGNATSGYSPNDLLETFLIDTGAYAFINTGLNFSGCAIEFDIAGGAGQSNTYLLFGCNATGAGPFFVLATGSYGNAGIGTSTDWNYAGSTPGTASSRTDLNSSIWYHVRIAINASGNYATWYVNGVVQQQVAITLEGGYLGVSAYSISGNIANIRIYNG